MASSDNENIAQKERESTMSHLKQAVYISKSILENNMLLNLQKKKKIAYFSTFHNLREKQQNFKAFINK
jgi:hypothetical protein